jgi:putative ABC transport system substrate-binding protein
MRATPLIAASRKRLVLAALALALVGGPSPVGAQPTPRLHRIGFLGNSTTALEANLVDPFRQGLRERGYVEGQDVVIEYRWADGKYERFPDLIAELIRLKVDVIVTAGTPAGWPSSAPRRLLS